MPRQPGAPDREAGRWPIRRRVGHARVSLACVAAPPASRPRARVVGVRGGSAGESATRACRWRAWRLRRRVGHARLSLACLKPAARPTAKLTKDHIRLAAAPASAAQAATRPRTAAQAATRPRTAAGPAVGRVASESPASSGQTAQRTAHDGRIGGGPVASQSPRLIRPDGAAHRARRPDRWWSRTAAATPAGSCRSAP
jgi:pyruvate/2-oxoglutarate dehydrogenase complex dihydrolipoamide acyltransferase (E2) component